MQMGLVNESFVLKTAFRLKLVQKEPGVGNFEDDKVDPEAVSEIQVPWSHRIGGAARVTVGPAGPEL